MSERFHDASRRAVVGGLAGGLLAAIDGPASAQSGGSGGAASSLENPQTAYPQPPFPRQQQEWPGLGRRMQPQPDTGEGSYRGSGRLQGRRALVTGGDSGIGRAAVIAFAREGADVAISYLPAEQPDAEDVARIVREAGRKAVLLPGDIREEAFCDRLVSDAVRELGGLDILVNNAARQHALESITELTTELLDWTMKTNIYAMVWITRAAVPHLPPGAAIINTTSVVAYQPPENLLDYATTKGAIMVFTKALAKQLAGKGIRVNGVAPGPIWTPLQVTGGQPPDRIPQFGAGTPLERPGQPAELAPLYVLLASSESSYSTGQIFGAVGGGGGP
ncbi:SDR family oxidoreductase [Rhodoplanes sp. TEM]|uniref:SDR family oxidoreductase n=1 Tax=Rhodoplanes tepidamans TaxID=200616 RepID=A0ABT5J6Q7_RHOTP|nr:MULTISPECIES: SDR family oxidoreductase [Rhodoplanes]MDC7785309.1 SDR family oxidoreductase [Rhodoplanes tepidamans]MDC7987274.1 SDR family oxidoreductase [Rhodoplanes sp. TEM]MDQ0353567.1 NAD(P)-dependent dehydrogenase (short-subunit alcohol dehydrogenase family) [Rhodoplanes tepidamans]